MAAHECGHAIQDQEDYVPLRFRSAFVPVANLGTQVAFPILLLGVFLGSSHFLIQVGLLCFFFGVLFQLITLPVEFNASGRAVRILRETGMMSDESTVSGSYDIRGSSGSIDPVHVKTYYPVRR